MVKKRKHFGVLACCFLYLLRPLESATPDNRGVHSAAAVAVRWRALVHKTKFHTGPPTLHSALGGHPTLPAVHDVVDIAGLANYRGECSTMLHVRGCIVCG